MDANLQNGGNAAAVQPGDSQPSQHRFVETRLQHLSYEEVKNMYPQMSEKDLYRYFRDGFKTKAVVTDRKEVWQISKTEAL